MRSTSGRSPNLLKRAVVILACAFIGLMIVAVFALLSLISDPQDNTESVNEIVSTVSRESSAVTDAYLDAAESSGAMAARSVSLSGGRFDEGLLRTLENVVAEHSNVDGVFVGLPSGDFAYVSRSLADAEGGYRVRIIEHADGPDRLVTELQTDAAFRVVEEHVLPDDTYDPRVRPWYLDALDQEQGWTDPYRFQSSDEPGITHFRRVTDTSGVLLAVVGVDIRLTEIGAFLAERRPSENGFAAIVTDDGTVISGLDDELDEGVWRQLADAAATLEPGEMALTEWTSTSDDNIAALTRVGGDSQWTLAVTAPPGDFLTELDRQAARFRDLIPVVGILFILLVVPLALWALRRIDRLQDDATTDALTGLLNRAEVRNRLGQLLEDEPNALVAAVSLDFDDFRTINDVWGHLVGDKALVTLTERLAAALGDRDFAGRIGGDEFLAVMFVRSEATANDEISRIMRRLLEPMSIEGASLTPSLSCGFCLRRPADDIGMVTLLRNADLALLASRSQHELVVQFDDDMVLPSLRDNERSLELHAAVDRDEFEIHFQPEVDIATGSVVGAEALLRWRHPDGSLAPAGQFIDDLERLGVIDRLTPLLVSTAERLAELIADPTFTVRLNFGGEQLRNPATIDAISAANRRTTIEWCLEVTERTIVESDAAMLMALDELVGHQGVTLALDDFGTGYSSLAELGNLPITTVKVDRSFVDTLTLENAETSLVSIIQDMAERLELEVVAEGIETEEQRRALTTIGCRRGQGWLFGAAVPLDEFVLTAGRGPRQAV